jgi:hypothetical protein
MKTHSHLYYYKAALLYKTGKEGKGFENLGKISH